MPSRKSRLPSRSNVTLADVARLAGVAKSTASFAFSGKRKISDATKQRIFTIAEELGYRPNPHAQSLGAGRATRQVGLFSLTLDYIAWKTMSSLHHELAAEGYDAPLYTYGYSEEITLDADKLLLAICEQVPEGIICNSFKLPPKDCHVLEEYQHKGGALVCLRTAMPLQCDQVIFDREQNTYIAANYLLNAGHRDIGFCSFNATNPTSPRTRGFIRALQEYSINSNPHWMFEGGREETGGAELAENFLTLEKRPSALCVVNDIQASTFVHQLLRVGVRVPEDVSVVSLDNMPAAKHCMVPLTAVTQPWEKMANLAAKFLIQRMQHDAPQQYRQITFSGELVERESVRRRL